MPVPRTANPYDFSFSGLTTAVLQLIQREEKKGNPIIKEDLAYAFQETALQSMVKKTIDAVKEYHPAMLVLGGGVAADEIGLKVTDTGLVLPCGSTALWIR